MPSCEVPSWLVGEVESGAALALGEHQRDHGDDRQGDTGDAEPEQMVHPDQRGSNPGCGESALL
jgi:hypothetical protein